jgi:hypothetical protein
VPLDPALREGLAHLGRTGRLVAAVVTPHIPPDEPKRSAAAALRLRGALDRMPAPAPGRLLAVDAVREYHTALHRLFAEALGFDGQGEPPATVGLVRDIARRMLLDDVLIPYDQHLGQIRHPPFYRGLRAGAEHRFAEWMTRGRLVPEGRRAQVGAVYRGLLDLVGQTIDSARADWGDSRYVWVPLQLALTPEEHDTQSEIDALVERITGIALEPGHDLIYTTDERFEPALQRSILQARDYHVLWVHDFAGRNPDHAPDTVSHQVVQAYLTALTAAAADFDRTGRMRTYILFMDQYYFGRSRSAWWLRLLADPLGHRFDLPGPNEELETAVRESQRRLREAVAQSAGLQAERRRRGERWLRGTVAVQVNITHPPDPSFRGPRAPGVLAPGLTDDVMRDHRKVAFADITERDPSRGIAILTGLGIGEHYARFQWLDRTLIVRGSAAVTLKSEARALLRSHGFGDGEIPRVLRPDSAPADLDRRVAALEAAGWRARVGIAMNIPGYGPKRATAAKAALYTLLPAGCTIVAADPQWLSRFWGGLLLGSAMRGCRVLLIGPGPANAPFSTGFVQYTLQRDLFHRLMIARDTLRRVIERSGGLLALGLFREGYGTDNVAAGVREVRDGLRRNPFLREVLPFDPGVWDLFEQADSVLAALGHTRPPDSASWYHPRFHLKTQFFGTADGLRSTLGRPEWRRFFERRIGERLRESPAGTDITLDHLAPLREYLDGRSAGDRDRQVLYLEVGSHNQDPRSFMLDGEELCLVAGEGALLAAGDMLLLSTAGVEWLDNRRELDRYFPAKPRTLVEASRSAEFIF